MCGLYLKFKESRPTKNRTTRTPTPNYESTPTPAQGRNYSDKQNTERLPFVDRDRSDTLYEALITWQQKNNIAAHKFS